MTPSNAVYFAFFLFTTFETGFSKFFFDLVIILVDSISTWVLASTFGGEIEGEI